MSPIQVKICGLTNLADALAALHAGADLLGFICYAKSSRFVPPTTLQAIVAGVRAAQSLDRPAARCVGVFVNAPVEQIAATLARVGLDYAQLHGSEEPAYLRQLSGRAFKALRPTDRETALAEGQIYAELGPQDGPRLLVDAYDPHAYGGTGKVADWELAAALARRCPQLLLAGGLQPQNVAAAVGQVRPWGVDVSSGVEIAPGRKDHAAVQAFVAAAKGCLPPTDRQADGAAGLPDNRLP